MNFKQFLEGTITPETLHDIWVKATTVGIPVFRGHSELKSVENKPYSSDPGDFGRGVYYTTSGHRAQVYGGKGNVSHIIVKFNNPIVLSMDDAYELAEKYGTINKMRSGNDALTGAEKMTRDMLAYGHDGLIAIRRQMKYKKDNQGYYFSTHISDYGELEIVDYRPYFNSSV